MSESGFPDFLEFSSVNLTNIAGIVHCCGKIPADRKSFEIIKTLAIRRLRKKSSPWKEKLLKNILIISSQKNLVLSGRSFHTSPKSCRGRLLSYLNATALQTGSGEFDIPFSRQQLADYLNLERTNMSKELSHMQDEGLIEYRKSHFKLIRED